MSILIGIMQKKKEVLVEYIYNFTKVAVGVGDSDDGLKCWIFKKGLRSDYTFREKIGDGRSL